MREPRLCLIITGGTFDKEYDEIGGRLFFKSSHVDEMLELGRCSVKVESQTLMLIDSLDMTAADRKKILDACGKAKRDQIVITHGTDTMAETARYLGAAMATKASKIAEKTIVLTGAMVPYKFGSSDGLFNLGAALAFAQSLPAGVYVAMNGRALPWQKAKKDRRTGEFNAE